MQSFVRHLAESHTSLETLALQQTVQINSHLTTEIQQLEKLRIDDREYDNFVQSLFYPDIYSRREHIEHNFGGIEDSYEWIFRKETDLPLETQARDALSGQNNFARWLESGHGLYWIQGKAGSGKSTLMQHVCQHNFRLHLLKRWCGNSLLLTPAYFFWNAGSRLQKSIDGLLRSLIYQMLIECRELIGSLQVSSFHTTSDIYSSNASAHIGVLHSWNESRLLKTLRTLLQQSQIPVAVCMFIDGLDEIDGRYDSVIELISLLTDQENVKICLASRPELLFKKHFDGLPGLKLQDLTFHCIRAYTDSRLSHLISERIHQDRKNGHLATNLVDKIANRADGVFLWAVIAVRDVRDGLQGIVAMDELLRTVDSLPSELEDFFKVMLHRIGPAYRRDAARFLKIALLASVERLQFFTEFEELSLGHYYLILQQDPTDAAFNYEVRPQDEIDEICGTLKIQLMSHTAGLLEVAPQKIRVHSSDAYSESFLLRLDKVVFVHRTARDFMLENDMARSVLEHSRLTDAELHLMIAKASLANGKQVSSWTVDQTEPLLPLDEIAYKIFTSGLRHIAMAERLTGASQSNLMHSLDNGLNLHRKSPTGFRGNVLGLDNLEDFAFMSDEFRRPIDLIGLAAAMGTKHYVCDRLGFPIVTDDYAPELPTLSDYCKNMVHPSTLCWVRRSQSKDLTEATYPSSGSSSRHYLNVLRQCLKLEGPAQSWVDNAFAETYLLSCCQYEYPMRFDLVPTLLHQGANPMVAVRGLSKASKSTHFWVEWLAILDNVRIRSKNVTIHRSGGIRLDDGDHKFGLTPENFFQITKALIVNGADINYKIAYRDREFSLWAGKWIYYNSTDPRASPIRLHGEATAMFVLEECFGNEPEFVHFATNIESIVAKPTRKICKLEKGSSYHRRYGDGTLDSLTFQESNLLMSLVEDWERTGSDTDRETIGSTIQEMWDAHEADPSLGQIVPRQILSREDFE